MDTRGYVTDGRLQEEIDSLLGGNTVGAAKAPLPGDAFLAKLPPESRAAFEAVHARVEGGTFPDLYDFGCDLGADTANMKNAAPGAFALANDGSGNYWLLCEDGQVQCWSHDEGGHMETHNAFASLDDALACFVRYSAVREGNRSLGDVRPVFEEKANGAENGWSFYLEQLDELLEEGDIS